MGIAIKDFRMALRIDNANAKQALTETKEKIDGVKSELEALIQVGKKESDEYNQKKQILDQLNNKYNELRKVVGLQSLTFGELKKGARSLRAQLDNVVPGTTKWTKLDQEIKIVEKRMKELKGVSSSTQFSISKLADGFNKYAAVGASAIATMTGIALTARKCVDEYAEMQEAESQVRKYTGMTTEAVSDLNEEFKKMDTRTARTKLNDLAGDAGRLGLKGKEDILEFVDAADKINVALGEDLGDDAVKNIGKLAQMFGEDKKLGLRGAMLATGSAINEVAQNSSAAEAYLVGFTARVAGTANQAKIAQGNIIGYASVLDQNMQQQEMAATAFQTLMMKMFQEPTKFARLAGENVEEFARLVKKDANEAILTLLDSLNQRGGLDQLAPMFEQMGLDGVRASGVLSTMAGKIDDIRKAQGLANSAYADGSSIINEFGVQNTTVQAELDKAKKNFADIRIELGEQLLPLMKQMVSTGTLTVKGLKLIVSILSEHKGVIASTAIAIAAYTLVVKGQTYWTNICAAATKAATVATNLFHKATKASPWGLVLAGLTAVASYLTIFKSSTDDATSSQKDFNSELDETKAALDRLAGIKMRGNNLDTLNDRQKQDLKRDAQTEVDILEDKLSKEVATFRKYYKEQESLIKGRTDLETQQKAALHRSLEIEAEEKGKELAQLLEKKNDLIALIAKIPQEGKKPLTDLTDGSDKKPWDTRLKSAETAHKKELLLLKQEADLRGQIEAEYQLDALQKETEYQAKRLGIIRSFKSQYNSKKDSAEIEAIELEAQEASYKSLQESEQARLTLLKEYRDRRISSVENNENQLKKKLSQQYENGELSERDYKNRLLTIDSIASMERLNILRQFTEDVESLEFKNSELKATAIRESGSTILEAEQEVLAQRGKILQNSEEQIRSFDGQLNKQNSSLSISDRLSQLEIFYQAQLMLAKKNGLSTLNLTKSYEEARKQIIEEYEQERGDTLKKYGLESAENSRDSRLKILEEEHRKGLLSEEEYEAAKNKIFNDYLKDKIQANQVYVNAFNSTLSDMSSAVQGFQDAEMRKVSRGYDKKIAAAKKAGKDTTKLEEEKEASVAAVKKKYAAMQFAINVMQTISSTAMAAMMAYSSLAWIPTVGPVLGAAAAAAAIAAGAAQIAVAKEQRDEAMGLKTGGYSQDYVEGYTKRGSSDDVAGVIPVHGNEFVANHDSVANPHVRQFLDVFDVAQRNGSIRMINTTQILEKIKTKAGRYYGGYTNSPEGESQDITSGATRDNMTDTSTIVKLLRRCEELLDIIARKKFYVNAREVRDEIKKIERMEKNVSR